MRRVADIVRRPWRWIKSREHGVIAIASLVTLALSVAFVLWRDDRNDDQLALAQCEVAAERSIIAVNLWTKITNAIPGDGEVEEEILDYILRCNPPRDCSTSLVAPPVPEDCFVVVVPPITATD